MSLPSALGSVAVILLTASFIQAQVLERRHTFKVADKPTSQVAVSADGKTIAAAVNQVDTKTWKRWTEFRVWDTASRKELASFQGHTDDSAALALSPQGDMLASCTYRGDVLLRSLKEMRERGYSVGGLGPGVRFSDDGGRLGAASEKGILLVAAPGDETKTVQYRGRLSVRAFSPDLRFLACSCHQDVDLLDTATGKLHATLPDHAGSVSFIAFSGDGKIAAVLARTYDDEGYGSQILVWDVAKQSVDARLNSPGYCTSLGVSNDGKFVITITDKHLRAFAHELRAIDVPTGKTISSIPFERSQTPHCQAFSRDCKVIVIGCHDGTVQLIGVK